MCHCLWRWPLVKCTLGIGVPFPMGRRRDSCSSSTAKETTMRDLCVHHLGERPRPQGRPRIHASGVHDSGCVCNRSPYELLSLRCVASSNRLSRARGRELAVVKELMHDWAPSKRRHRAVAEHGCVSEETEEQADDAPVTISTITFRIFMLWNIYIWFNLIN